MTSRDPLARQQRRQPARQYDPESEEDPVPYHQVEIAPMAKRHDGPVELCGASPLRGESLDVLVLAFRRLLQHLS